MSAQILYLINKTKVKNLCITWDHVEDVGFVQGDKFLGNDNLGNIFFRLSGNLQSFVNQYIKYVDLFQGLFGFFTAMFNQC